MVERPATRAMRPALPSQIYIPYIGKGEWITGLLGRIIELNGFPRSQAFLRKIVQAEAIRRGYLATEMVSQVALLAGLQIGEMIRSHTLIPLSVQLCPQSRLLRGMGLGREAPRPFTAGNRFCSTCALRESRHGFSMWKVCHQIIGADHCWDCGDSLYIAPPVASVSMPHSAAQECRLTQVPPVGVDLDAMNRHKAVMTAIMQAFNPTSIQTVRETLRTRAQVLGVLSSKGSVNEKRLHQLCYPYFTIFRVQDHLQAASTVLNLNEVRRWATFALAMGLSTSPADAVEMLSGGDSQR